MKINGLVIFLMVMYTAQIVVGIILHMTIMLTVAALCLGFTIGWVLERHRNNLKKENTTK